MHLDLLALLYAFTAALGPGLAAVSAGTLTPGRLAALLASFVGIASVVLGGKALARAAGQVGAVLGRRRATMALVLGLIGLIMGGAVVATAESGLGTGHGVGGGVVAIVVGSTGMVLGGLALVRARSR
jgi:hypothetical protein